MEVGLTRGLSRWTTLGLVPPKKVTCFCRTRGECAVGASVHAENSQRASEPGFCLSAGIDLLERCASVVSKSRHDWAI